MLLLGVAPTQAQQIFIAPTTNRVVATTEVSNGEPPAHLFFVSNNSTVPIVVFGVTTYECTNIKPSCGGRRTKIAIAAGARRMVGRVEAKDPEQAMDYRWHFSFVADSSDAMALAALREHGYGSDGSALASNAVQQTSVGHPTLTVTVSERPETDSVYHRLNARGQEYVRAIAEERANAPVSFRFKVAYGSILASTMMPDKPLQATGPCVDPAQSAKYEHDAKITQTPWKPPVAPSGFPWLSMAQAWRDSVPPGELLVRFVADTNGSIIPESVSVLESPNGKLSVRACTGVMSVRFKPARDKAGVAIRAWVQTPVRVSRD
jgi:hypothetical protein